MSVQVDIGLTPRRKALGFNCLKAVLLESTVLSSPFVSIQIINLVRPTYKAVTNTDFEGYEVTIVTRSDDYLYAEYKDPKLGFIDDVEFFFPPDPSRAEGARRGGERVEYRTAGRVASLPKVGPGSSPPRMRV